MAVDWFVAYQPPVSAVDVEFILEEDGEVDGVVDVEFELVILDASCRAMM